MLAGKAFRGPNLWPDVPGFRETLLSYYEAMLAFGRDPASRRGGRPRAAAWPISTTSCCARSPRCASCITPLRHPEARVGGTLGAGTHTDYGNLTLLATDAVGGLEVRTRDGAWIAAPSIPGTFVCNIGDCLMRWTNDLYCSTPHRVVSPAGRERYSVAFFLDADPDVVVEALPGSVAAGATPLYRPVTVADYLSGRLAATYAS